MADLLEKSPSKKRQIPPRVRKKNRFIYNDDEETDQVPSASRSSRRNAKSRPNSNNNSASPTKRCAQGTGIRLRNILKLPKAHKWVCYEWFYSNLDGTLFKGDNDLCVCLRESFPELKTRLLTRVEWCKIRRLMGKPRRLSSSFFIEERAALHNARAKIRTLQQRKSIEFSNFTDLPKEIPLPLVIGTKVTARLRKPADGLFTGTIDAVDTLNCSYRITFDRQGVGTHSVPDYEVLSNEAEETMPLASFAQKIRPRGLMYTPPKYYPDPLSPQISNDPLMGDGSPLKSGLLNVDSCSGTLGGFPINFLKLLVRLSKILEVKREKIKELKNLNTQAEIMKSYQEPIPLEYQKKYASIVLELENLNKDLNEYLLNVQQYSLDVAPDQGIQTTAEPLVLRKQCDMDAEAMVTRFLANNHSNVQDEHMMDLITKLMSLMMQIKSFGENDLNSFEFKSLSDSLADIKNSIDSANISAFQNNVEVHVNYIQSGLTQLGNLHAFQEQVLP